MSSSCLTKADLLKGESLYDIENVTVVHHVQQALRAHKLFQRDRDYIVKNDEVIIIDEFTGRMMQGRRYSEGLHQALEAKEHVSIQPENQTLATITFQNYFRLYEKLAGMTGTAVTEADEFMDIYGLDVVEVPTNMDMIRADEDDEVYRTAQEKYRAIIALIKDARKRGQPMLVGTTSIEKSEILSALLKKDKVPHQVLNARYHEQEAAHHRPSRRARRGHHRHQHGGTRHRHPARRQSRHVARRLARQRDAKRAAEPDAAEIAAKREEIAAEVAKKKRKALEAGGLYVVGTERHESRRIDNQLRGRSGRQGDPGRSRFFLSLEDDLMRIFGSQRMDGMLGALGLKDDEAIVHPWINKALEKAQAKVEARNFDIRKNLLKFDNVMNDQRKAIFEQRRELMTDADLGETIADMRHHVVDDMVATHIPEKSYAEQWDVEGLHAAVKDVFDLDLPIAEWAEEEAIGEDEMHERLIKAVDERAPRRPPISAPRSCARSRRRCCCRRSTICGASISSCSSICARSSGLRGYGQRDPLNEYKSESFTLFEHMLAPARGGDRPADACRSSPRPSEVPPLDAAELPPMEAHHFDPLTGEDEFALEGANGGGNGGGAKLARARKARSVNPADPTTWGKVQRNALCPCGSGKKYKHCHGASAKLAPSARPSPVGQRLSISAPPSRSCLSA